MKKLIFLSFLIFLVFNFVSAIPVWSTNIFNNSLTNENLNLSYVHNPTVIRYLVVPNTVTNITKALLNITGLTLNNQFVEDNIPTNSNNVCAGDCRILENYSFSPIWNTSRQFSYIWTGSSISTCRLSLMNWTSNSFVTLFEDIISCPSLSTARQSHFNLSGFGINSSNSVYINITLNVDATFSGGVLNFTNTQQNSTNVTIRLPHDTIFSHSGDYSITNRTINFSETLNKYLNATYLIGSNYIIPFTFSSNSTGALRYSALDFSDQTPVSLDNCSVNSQILTNISIVDEETQSFLNGSIFNITFEGEIKINDITHFNQTFLRINPIVICVSNLSSTNLKLDAQFRYQAFDRVSEFHHIQNFTLNQTSILGNITLYDLLIIDSQEFRITFKDSNFLPVQDALIDITRKYIGEGVFKSVEVPKTDVLGQTIGHLVLSDVIYTMIVKKNGQILAIFPDVIAICQDLSTGQCTINLQQALSGGDISDFATVNGIIFNIDVNTSTRTISSTFTTIDGRSINYLLNVSRFDANSTFVCSNSVTSSSGTVSCTIPAAFTNGTFIARTFSDGLFLGQAIFNIQGLTPIQRFGYTAIVITLLLYLTLPLIVATERELSVIFAILGLIIATMIGIFSGGNIIGLGSSILWFVIAGGIIIWKISRART